VGHITILNVLILLEEDPFVRQEKNFMAEYHFSNYHHAQAEKINLKG
jgi:hypothetical protein